MRLEEKRLIDDALVAEEDCLGAVFCSYTFDPAYFEEQVLRSVLRLRGDPSEDALGYHEEARSALQTTPVVCLIDASVRKAGHRLPYDIKLIRQRTFHPKTFLLLYESEARLAIGSGNLTKSGIEQNTELFFVRRLRYDERAAATLLRDFDDYLGECAALAGTASAQLDAVRQALQNRTKPTHASPASEHADVQFVSSFGGSLLESFDRALPKSASITRVGVLAPFFEQDDLAVRGSEDGLHSVLAHLLALRPSQHATLDIGAPWDDATLAAPASYNPSLDEHGGSLWAWRRRMIGEDVPVECIDYFVINGTAKKRIQATNAAGRPYRLDRDTLEAEIEERKLWRVPKPVVHAPNAVLQRIARERPVTLWLHPTTAITASGRPARRPLHAKAMLVTVGDGGQTHTYALIGSANASKAALARGTAQGGNVEAGVLCRFDGEVTLHDLLPSLVHYSLNDVTLVEREQPITAVDLSAWIEEVLHDAAARTLRVLWRAEGPEPLGTWSLRYLDRELVRGDGAPVSASEIENFDLAAASAEVTFAAAKGEWQLPIRVLDLAALPRNPFLASLSLRELLALLGHRVGAERLGALHAERGAAGVQSALDMLFGEGFGPTDVFKAWWGAAEELSSAPTVAAFRHRLIAATGLATVWRRLREVPNDVLSPDEVWVYGLELLRELEKVAIPDGPDLAVKRALLDDFVAPLRRELKERAPRSETHALLSVVSEFYGIGGTDDNA